MQDFWQSSGFSLLERNDYGWLRVTPEYVRTLLLRPELAPITESGKAEIDLHSELLNDPFCIVTDSELAKIADVDTRENYRHFLSFRKRLRDAVTLERFYLQQFRTGVLDIPPLFIDMVAHAIVRGILDSCEDPYEVRAGELFFREQRVSIENGHVLSADAETIQEFANTGGFGSVGRLLAQQGTPLRSLQMDVMSHENAQLYWLRESRYPFLLDLTYGRAGLDALSRVLEKWVLHFLGCATTISPMRKIEDESWRWHVGLDVESTAILNALYQNTELDDSRLERMLSLFTLTFDNPADAAHDMRERPVYLGLAMTADNRLKLKPQNLLLNLPLAAEAA